jgi:hypothetical protein
VSIQMHRDRQRGLAIILACLRLTCAAENDCIAARSHVPVRALR